MPGGLGVLGYIGFAWESSGGVAVAQPQVYAQALSEEVSPEYDRYERFNIINRLSEPDDKSGVLRVEGEIELPFEPVSGGFLLTAALGSATVSSVAGGMWMHSWKIPTQSQWDNRFALRPFTTEIFRDVGSAQQYTGSQVGGIELMIEPNADLRFNVTLLATDTTNKAATTASYSSIAPFAFESGSFSIDGSANQDLESWSYNYVGSPGTELEFAL